MRKIYILIVVFCTLLLAISCAKRGTITGGDKDKTPPKITSSFPENFSTNFNKNTIKINFDEYVKIKDLQKQLIISPPMKTPITVLPQGSASKYITIKINDTLKPNTTYSFNFGKSIVDYNEGNPYPQLKYVLSTGAFIDSLSVEGIIRDSYEKETDKSVNVMLYEVDEKYNDSIIYKQTPRYITNTSDSLKSFKIENIKAGKYKLVALKEIGDNYKFDPNKDKIGFYNQTITVPDKSIFELELFKEEAKFKSKKPSQASGNRVLVGYEGNTKNIKIETKKNGNLIKTRVTKFADKDSVQVWFAPIKNDSIQLNIENGKYKKDYIVKLKNQRQDSLKLSPKQTGAISFKENFTITTKTPLDKFDVTKMTLTKKDSSKVDFKTNYDEYNQHFEILFTKEPEEKYTFSLLPNAVEDYLGQKNDSLTFKFSTKNTSDYGNLKINLKNVKSFPVIIELTDKSGKILATEYSENNPTIEFLLMEPQKYSLRIIYDENKNKQRDTGSYLENRQPEEVVHYPTEIDVRANWDVNQDFDLSK
ncbi:Ig-like domain-containing protein [Flavobacterium sp.]|uniref:Ig-like domain-containing protein n=1 Tax=Flavobacterium sp. TaxID=239 RepID=UPI0038FD1B48